MYVCVCVCIYIYIFTHGPGRIVNPFHVQVCWCPYVLRFQVCWCPGVLGFQVCWCPGVLGMDVSELHSQQPHSQAQAPGQDSSSYALARPSPGSPVRR